MSVEAKRWVAQHSRARGTARQVLEELAWRADARGRGARRSTAQLAEATGRDRRTVQRVLRALEAGGHVERHDPACRCQACRQAARGVVVYDVIIGPREQVAAGQLTLPTSGTMPPVADRHLRQDDVRQGRQDAAGSYGTVPPLKDPTTTTETSSALTHAASGVGLDTETAPGGKGIELTSRRHAEAVACPACGADSGSVCVRRNGDPRVQFHAARHAAAIERGAPVADPSKAAAGPRGRARPGTRVAGTSPRALGTNPRALAARGHGGGLLDRLTPPSASDELLWQSLREQARQAVPESAWELWLASLSFAGRDGDTLVLEAPTPGSRAWIQGSFARVLDACAVRAAGPGARVRLVDPLPEAAIA